MTHEHSVEKHAAERYLLDDMPELERFAFEEHLFACPMCAEDVRTGALMQEGVKAGLLPPVKAEGTRHKAEGRRQKAQGRRQKAKGKRQKAEGRRQKAEGRRQKAETKA
jgi:anti-sigma factor RsiW